MKPLVTFIACSHNESFHNRIFVPSVMNQTDQNFRAVVYNNGPNPDNEISDSLLGIDNIKYIESDMDTGNYGCVNRQTSIDHCKTDYIIQSSVQDYWLPQAVITINTALSQKSPDLLIWNSINHLVGPCVPLDAKLEWSKLDWGNFAISTKLAQMVGINHGDQYCADWLFINDLMNSGLIDMNKVMKIPHILTIHN